MEPKDVGWLKRAEKRRIKNREKREKKFLQKYWPESFGGPRSIKWIDKERERKLNDIMEMYKEASKIEDYEPKKAIKLYEKIADLKIGFGNNYSEAAEAYEKAAQVAGHYARKLKNERAKNYYLKRAEKLSERAEEYKGKTTGREDAGENGLVRKIGIAALVFWFFASGFYLTNHFTGNAILDVNFKNSNLFGAVLFFMGIVATYYLLKKRKNDRR